MERKVGIIYSPEFSKHKPESSSPERPERLTGIVNRLKSRFMFHRVKFLTPNTLVDLETLQLVHDPEYIESIQRKCSESSGEEIFLDSEEDFSETYANQYSYEVSLLALGGITEAVDFLMREELSAIFCAIRPPGHHASRNKAGGFCVFNNAAVAAKYAIESYGLDKILILDWDIHHGNGTQEIFYCDPKVYYFGIHSEKMHPRTGSEDQEGFGDGKGFNRNIVLKKYSGDKVFIDIFKGPVKETILKHQPELIIVSAGFDGHMLDSLGDTNLSAEVYGKVTKLIKTHSKNIPILSVLEGGYNLESLPESVYKHVESLI